MKILKYLVIFLVVVSASFLAIGFITPSISYETTVMVNKPVAHSFKVFNNPFNLKKWMPGLKRFAPISGVPNTVGSKSELVFVENGEEFVMEEELTAYERNKLYAFTMTNDFLDTKVKITFEEVEGMTKITAVSEAQANNMIFRSLFPFMKSSFQEKDEEFYTNLKELIESTDYGNNLLLDFFLDKG